MLDKPTLRRQLLARRKEISLADWQMRSAKIVSRVQDHLQQRTLNTVALYAPIVSRREVDVAGLDSWLRARGIAVAYPIMTSTMRGFALTVAPPLTEASGFAQPAAGELLRPGELDLIVVPALGVTTAGYRLGYGAGFYDEQLRRFCPPAFSICVAFTEQVMNELPLEPHDVACGLVVTDE